MASAAIPPLSPDPVSSGAVDLREYYRLRIDAETRLRREGTVIDVQPTRVNLEAQTQGRTTASERASSDATSAQTLASRQARARQTQTPGASSRRARSVPQETPPQTPANRMGNSPAADRTLRYTPGGKQGIELENSPQTLGMIIDLTV